MSLYENNLKMVLTVSLYPLLAKRTGITRVYSDDIETSTDVIAQYEFLQRCIEDTLELHPSATYEIDDDEHERYTIIVTFRKACFREEFPFTIEHFKPRRYTCTKTFDHMTKKDIRKEMRLELERVKEQIEEEERESIMPTVPSPA